MTIQEACRLLGIRPGEDERIIRRKYHRLIRQVHPDESGADQDSLVRAQQLNEAFALVCAEKKKEASAAPKRRRTGMGRSKGDAGSELRQEWRARENPGALCGRYIFFPHGADDQPYRAAYGKYYWDPAQEEFSLFLFSLRRLSLQLFNEEEERAGGIDDETEAEALRMQVQPRLLEYLLELFVLPSDALPKLKKPTETDEEGRPIYHFPAHLRRLETRTALAALRGVEKGMLLTPAGFEKNRLMVARAGTLIGHVAFEDDALYCVVYPLLRRHSAQARIRVEKAQTAAVLGIGRYQVRLDMAIRVSDEDPGPDTEDVNRRIRHLLGAYRTMVADLQDEA